ncbi:glycosyl amidation-associated protein WbuZ [Niastella caeni]|uniref:imidazole glycerol-phosphate synthase n=1 Tax=Niastella caeni TaxID=2569763 RepID=A0A4S8I0W3_9BACT|nr:AglZ/HisF2 family acetamidino modification protein [Niastella caeni]THU41525.1 glycosyl amidation-associated protein WbuZ [Niastella caeni]
MKRVRVIPVLLLKGEGLVKSVQFKNHKYVGDPINAVKIFNEKEVDELALIDISATREGKKPDLNKIAEIAGEAFMPLSYGGGITDIKEVKDILFNGIEKVIINKSAFTQPSFISRIAERFGSQSVVVSIDVKKNVWGKYNVYINNGTENTKKNPVDYACECEKLGAGEILLNVIERDGTYKGFDIDIVQQISRAVNIPVVACGGAGSLTDFKQAIVEGGASAVAAGSMFVFQRPHNAVLISYPSQTDLMTQLYNSIT